MSFYDKCTNWCVTAATAIVLALVPCARPVWADVHFTVGTPQQGGQYLTVQAAVDAVPNENIERHIIDIKPGTYTARVIVPSTKPFITLRGEDPLTTKLTFNEPFDAAPNESTNHASTVVLGKDFIAENLTFENTYGVGKQALALYAKGDRAIFNNCRFLGFQDTLRSENGRHYFYNSYVEGTVDFVYGKGTAFFENSTLFAKSNGYFTAQGRESALETNGFVFKNSTITGSATNGSVYLGRPWQLYSRAVFLESRIGPVVPSAGWSAWSGNSNHLTAYFAEYNSMDVNGDPLNVSQRASWSHQLTAEEVAPFSKENWLGGTDGWNPSIVLPLAGDYNNDGFVDTADYTVWRDSLQIGLPLLNETVSLGMVDAADYDAWKSNFGATSGFVATSAQAVPEPNSLLMSLALYLAFASEGRATARRR